MPARLWMNESMFRKIAALVPRRLSGRRWECRTGRHKAHRSVYRAMRCERTPVVDAAAQQFMEAAAAEIARSR